MKYQHLLLAGVAVAVLAGTSCRTMYVDRTVYVEVTPTPKKVTKTYTQPPPKPRFDNPDNFDAVQKPTSYSY